MTNVKGDVNEKGGQIYFFGFFINRYQCQKNKSVPFFLGIQVLNVAVPRASKDPGIHDAEMNILESVLEL